MKYWPLIWSALARKPTEGLLTVFAVATGFTLLALVAMLSAKTGILRAFRIAGDPRTALVLPNTNQRDDGSGLAPDIIGTILDAPGNVYTLLVSGLLAASGIALALLLAGLLPVIQALRAT